jgi:adenylate cyclase
MSDSQVELPATVPTPARVGFLIRARRRGVLRVAASYAVIAWLLLQIADVTFDPLGVPKWVITSLIVAAVLGFPVAVALAWFYEMGDRGVQRDTAAEDAARPSVHGKRRFADLAIIGVLLITVAVLLVRQSDIGKPKPPPNPAVAVLPFENLSATRSRRTSPTASPSRCSTGSGACPV